MAEPYDYILAEYIRLGKKYALSINSSSEMALGEAEFGAINEFGSIYTSDEYNAATLEAEIYVLSEYSNLFTRIPD